MTSRLYSAPEVASILGIKLDTLYRYARKGKIRGVKLGNLWRFAESDVERFIDGRRYIARRLGAPKLLADLLKSVSGGGGGVVCGGTRASYEELDLLSDRLAKALVGRGLGPGDRVVMALPNSLEFVVACFAIWKARAVAVPEYTAIRPANFRKIIAEVRPTALIVGRSVAERLEDMGDALAGVKAVFMKERTFALSGLDQIDVESLDAVLGTDAAADIELPGGASLEDEVSITYTSGSLGVPKGVVHTNDSWLASAEFTREYLGLAATDKIAIPLPQHHGLAFRHALAYFMADATVVVAADIYQALRLLREERPTALLLVPAAVNIALDHFSEVLEDAGPHLRYLEIGSAAIAPERLARLRELLPNTDIHVPYGLTEARVAYLAHGSDGLLNRIGTVSPGLELQALDEAGSPIGRGETGEITLRGRGLMKGYWGDGAAARNALAASGFRTGDMGRLDANGQLALLGRLDEVLKVGGRKVNPLEVEMALNRHSDVVESAVVGIPDRNGIFECVPHAVVVPKRDADLSESELLAYCGQQLESYKVPAQVHLRSSLPKSPVGKVLRQALAMELSSRLNSSEGARAS